MQIQIIQRLPKCKTVIMLLVLLVVGWARGRRNAPAASCGRVQITPWNFLANGNIFQVKGFVKYFSREAQAWSVTVRGSRGGKTGILQLFKLFRDQSRK